MVKRMKEKRTDWFFSLSPTHRGFHVLVPGYAPDQVDSNLYQADRPLRDVSGLAKLLLLDHRRDDVSSLLPKEKVFLFFSLLFFLPFSDIFFSVNRKHCQSQMGMSTRWSPRLHFDSNILVPEASRVLPLREGRSSWAR